MLPKDEREIGRVRFAECLRAIVAQQLLPRHDETGNVVACEVLLGTPEVRAALRETARIDDLKGLMAGGHLPACTRSSRRLAALVSGGKITAEAARAVTLPSATPPPSGVPERRKRSKAWPCRRAARGLVTVSWPMGGGGNPGCRKCPGGGRRASCECGYSVNEQPFRFNAGSIAFCRGGAPPSSSSRSWRFRC